MRQTKADMRERIAIRAYFAWLNGSAAGADGDWLEAQAIESVSAERRVSRAKKAAKARWAKALDECRQTTVTAAGSSG